MGRVKYFLLIFLGVGFLLISREAFSAEKIKLVVLEFTSAINEPLDKAILEEIETAFIEELLSYQRFEIVAPDEVKKITNKNGWKLVKITDMITPTNVAHQIPPHLEAKVANLSREETLKILDQYYRENVDKISPEALEKTFRAQYFLEGELSFFKNTEQGVEFKLKIITYSTINNAYNTLDIFTGNGATLREAIDSSFKGKLRFLGWPFYNLEGKVLSKNEEMVEIDLGKNMGIRNGDKFMVFRNGDPIYSEYRGNLMGYKKVNLAYMEAIEVKEKSSICRVVHFTTDDQINLGDLVMQLNDNFYYPIGQ